MRALVHAVRWDIGMDLRDFLGNILEGERWLVQAAGAVRLFSSYIYKFRSCNTWYCIAHTEQRIDFAVVADHDLSG